MKPHELTDLLRHIRNSYGKPMVTEEIKDFIAGHVKHIPSEAVKWIGQQLIRRYQKCPDVLHTAILDLFHSWQCENPDKCAADPYRRSECPNDNCFYGWMSWWGQDEFYKQEIQFVVNCADCKRSNNTQVKRMSFTECLEKRWEPDTVEYRAKHRVAIAQDVQAVAEKYRIDGKNKVRSALNLEG